MTVLSAVMGVLLGLCVGSFLGCAAYRLPRGISLSEKRSFCPTCETPVKNRYNIPVFGYLFLRGRTACCGEKLSASYPVWEAGTAVAFGVIGFLTNVFFVFALTFVTIFAVVIEEKLRKRRSSG